jgi:hypothetical protein
LREGDRKLAERLAHTVAGVAANLGALGAQSVATDLENSIRNNDAPEQTDEILESFAGIVGPLAAHLKVALGEPVDAASPSPAGPIDGEILKATLAKLVALLKDSDSAAVDYGESIRGELMALLGSTRHGHFENALEAYDFDEALCCLKTVSDKLNLPI